MPQKVSETNELDFLKDKDLRKTIGDAVRYIQIIFEQARNSSSALYKEETYRVIILYVVSIIEAILLYVFNSRGETTSCIDYSYASPLPQDFKHSKLPKHPVVIAVQRKTTADTSRIGCAGLVNFMLNSGLMKKGLAQEVLEINSIRNTFHFTKPRNEITCEIKKVEDALELLVKIIKEAPKMMVFKK